MGRLITVEIVPLARACAMVNAGEADGFFGVVKTEDREQFAIFPTHCLLYADVSLFVAADSGIRFDGDFGKLGGYLFGMIQGSKNGTLYDAAVASGTLKNLVAVAEHRQNLFMLIYGRVDLIVGPRVVLWTLAREEGVQSKIWELFPPLESIPTYLAFSKRSADTGVAKEFDSKMDLLERNGTLSRISEKTRIPPSAKQAAKGGNSPASVQQ